MERPLVSICLLTYMHKKYIADCLVSLINQTYSNIELLILDDASTDSTMDIIRSYEQAMNERFVRVFIKHNEINSGNIAANLNVLLRQAQGQYIKTFAGDDMMLPELIEETVACLEENKQFIMCCANAYIVNDQYRPGSKRYQGTWEDWWPERPWLQEDKFKKLLEGNYVCAPSSLIRAEAYDKYGLYDETISVEDYEFWLRLFYKEDFGYLDRPLVYYRRAATSVTNYKRGDALEKYMFIICNDKKTIEKHLKKLPFEERRLYQQQFFHKWLIRVVEDGVWRLAGQLLIFMLRNKYRIDKKELWRAFQQYRDNIERI